MDSGFTALPVPGAAVALAFSPGTEDMVVATGDGQIWSVKQENGQPKYYLIGSGRGQSRLPQNFPATAATYLQRLLTARSPVFDFTGSAPALISCGCSPLAFQRGKGNSAFFLQDSSSPLPQLVDGKCSDATLPLYSRAC